MQRLLGALAVLALASCGTDERPQRVLVVGWDGATFDVLDPLIDSGTLPHLTSLIREGRSAVMESTKIPISSAAWPTLTTGRSPGEHGVYSFFRRSDDDSYDVRLVSARDIDAPPMWRTLSRRHHVVHVWGVPLTFPPEPVQGTLVAGMLSPLDATYAFPDGLTATLRDTGFVPDVGIWRQERATGIDEIHSMLEVKERAVLEQLEKPDWTFAMVVFKSLDVLCHNPATDLAGPEVRDLLVRLDQTLGKLRTAAGPDAVTIFVSDHGFTTYRRTFNLHRWLVERGYSVQRADANVDAPAAGPLAAFRASERLARLNTLELDASLALADVCEGNFGSIRLNVVGREPQGTVARGEMDSVMDAIERDLRSLEFPAGVPLVRSVDRARDLYPGEHQDAILPDLVIEFAPEFRCVAATFGEVRAVGHAPFPDHALDGVFAIAGADVIPSNERGRVRLVDIAPLVFHALREPIPSNWTGSPNAAFFDTSDAPQRIDASRDPSLIPTEEVYRSIEEVSDREVTERIQGSGYAD